jgi:HAD superfamily hydrolase (TIGR01662 family)
MQPYQQTKSLYIFDKDGTLIKNVGFGGFKPRNPLKPEDQVLKPGVFEKIAELRSQGHVIAMASNMSAVADGLITMDQAEALMENCAEKIGGCAAWRCCGYSPKGKKKLAGSDNPYARDDPCRKPHPGMILDLMRELEFTSENTFMVGNEKTDEKAAEAAGVHYIKARNFFKVKEAMLP